MASRKEALQNQLPLRSNPQPYWHEGLVFMEDNFSTDQVAGVGIWMISKWFEHITFIVHLISVITSAPPQIIRH